MHETLSFYVAICRVVSMRHLASKRKKLGETPYTGIIYIFFNRNIAVYIDGIGYCIMYVSAA